MNKKKMSIRFPEFDIEVEALLLEDEEPELCASLLEKLPLRGACVSTLSTGDLFFSRMRPPRQSVTPGTQAHPAGRNSVVFCNTKPGDIGYSGLDFLCIYGNNITEPLPGSGAIVMKVDQEGLPDFLKAGDLVWKNMCFEHKLVTMVVDLKEEK